MNISLTGKKRYSPCLHNYTRRVILNSSLKGNNFYLLGCWVVILIISGTRRGEAAHCIPARVCFRMDGKCLRNRKRLQRFGGIVYRKHWDYYCDVGSTGKKANRSCCQQPPKNSCPRLPAVKKKVSSFFK